MQSSVRCIVPLVFILILSAFSGLPEKPAAGLNLHGYHYIAFPFIDLNGNPIATSNYRAPIFFVLGQDGNSVYGTYILPDADKLLARDSSSALGDTAVLVNAPLIKGNLNGMQLTITQEDPLIKGKVIEVITATLENNGESASLVTRQSTNGSPVNVQLMRCNQNDHLSGLYIGKVLISGFPPAAGNNIVLGLWINGSTARLCTIIRDDAGGELPMPIYVETGTYNPATRTADFTFMGVGFKCVLDANGMLKLSSSGGTNNLSGTLRPFNNPGLPPKLGKVKPNTAAPGSTQTFIYKVKNAWPGCLVSDDSKGVTITGFRLFGKTIELYATVSPQAKGFMTATLTNADGRASKTKKKVSIQ